MRACYVAGPMRSRPHFNYPAFFAAEDRLRDAGWNVFNPARMDAEEAPMGLAQGEQEAHASKPDNSRRYAKRDLDVIVNVLKAEDGDAVVTLEGWEDSTGARAEVAVANWVGLKVIALVEALRG